MSGFIADAACAEMSAALLGHVEVRKLNESADGIGNPVSGDMLAAARLRLDRLVTLEAEQR